MRFIALFCLTLSLVACGSNPPAPVIDRVPANKPSDANLPAQKSTTANRPTYKTGDWRPDTYVVKKGDNLFSIGLEHGYYYKDIAQANNIAAPYNIRVGQVLKFKALKDKSTVASTSTENKPNAANNTATANTDGVEITPISTEATSTGITPVAPVIAITEPKATREAYSEEALKKPLPSPKPVIATTVEQKPEAKPELKPVAKPEAKIEPKSETKPSSESPEDIDWAWPAKGKVTANFNEASNKGIDISGVTGQAVNAAAAGKVIYSGSDLRGYGKLVIIKHNATYLSVYAHNSLIVVKEGQLISRGQKIAEMGNTDTNAVKLHFEIRRQGKSVDPSKYLAAN